MSDAEVQVPERRVFRRTGLSRTLEIDLLPGDSGSRGGRLRGTTINIGCGGVLVLSDRWIDPGTACSVHLLATDTKHELDEIRGVVRRVRQRHDGTLLGIAFEDRLQAIERWNGDKALPSMSDWLLSQVLVADDESDVRDLLARFLLKRGCEVETVSDGEAVLQAVRRSKPDMLLLDLRLPRLNGLDVLARIREEELEVGPIWAISAYASDGEAIEAMRRGATDFVNKPLDLQYLEWSIQLQRGL
ncbi:MAG: response regulator [Acidobacteriota bacterium]